jgi:hypothetical protein
MQVLEAVSTAFSLPTAYEVATPQLLEHAVQLHFLYFARLYNQLASTPSAAAAAACHAHGQVSCRWGGAGTGAVVSCLWDWGCCVLFVGLGLLCPACATTFCLPPSSTPPPACHAIYSSTYLSPPDN